TRPAPLRLCLPRRGVGIRRRYVSSVPLTTKTRKHETHERITTEATENTERKHQRRQLSFDAAPRSGAQARETGRTNDKSACQSSFVRPVLRACHAACSTGRPRRTLSLCLCVRCGCLRRLSQPPLRDE